MVLGGIKSCNFEMVRILYPTKKKHSLQHNPIFFDVGVHIQPYFTKPLDLAVAFFFFRKALIVGGLLGQLRYSQPLFSI